MKSMCPRCCKKLFVLWIISFIWKMFLDFIKTMEAAANNTTMVFHAPLTSYMNTKPGHWSSNPDPSSPLTVQSQHAPWTTGTWWNPPPTVQLAPALILRWTLGLKQQNKEVKKIHSEPAWRQQTAAKVITDNNRENCLKKNKTMDF